MSDNNNATSAPVPTLTALPTDSPSSLPSAAEMMPVVMPIGPPTTTAPFAEEEEDEQQDCDCSSCITNSTTDTKTIRIVTPPELEQYLQYHIEQYHHPPGIQFQIEVVKRVDENKDSSFRALQQRLLLGDKRWDGAMFPTQLLGNLEKDLLDLNTTTQPVMPFYQKQIKLGNVTKVFALDGNIYRMLYRADLMEQYGLKIPRTWDEYQQVAEFFNINTNLQGSCVSTCNNYKNNADRAFVVLSTMTQTMGTSSGFLLDPITTQPIWGDAMEETLRLVSEHGFVDKDCQGGGLFAKGECALTYTWDTGILAWATQKGLDVGVAPTPGSSRVLDPETGKLVNCTPALCPFGEYYDDVGIVNRAPYAALGEWASGIANSTTFATEMSDFLVYLQSQSLADVLPNIDRTSQLDPYQYEHVQAYRWINEGGLSPDIAQGLADSSRSINSLNAVLNLRFSQAESFLDVFEEEIASYLEAIENKPNIEFQEAIQLRERANTRMTARVENLITADPNFVQSYQDSIGFLTAPEDAFNYINGNYRNVAWGMSGLIVFASISLVFWTILFRKNPVMRAFQPFLLIQCAVGVFLMGGTIVLIGLDDKMFDKEILDFTCMAAPWGYVVGFTVFFSSVYCKIEGCAKIFRDPQKYKVLFVSMAADARLTFRLLILNGAILTAWSVSDPLRWVRYELDGGRIFPDGTVETYGMCRGAEFTSFAFATVLYLLNMIMLTIAIVRALKCQKLVMEYNELQWLTLALLPFIECWLVGASVLALSRDNPTVVFTTLAIAMSVSSASAGLAIFAPKDWYVRKYKYMEIRSRKDFEHTSDAGILLLQHPKFENRKQLDHLQNQLQETLAMNTELELEIRGMQERFREITHVNEHYAHSKSSVRALVSPLRLSRAGRKLSSKKIRPEQAPPVWKMPDDEDETEVDLAETDNAGPLESFSPLKQGQMDSSTKPHEAPTPVTKNGTKSGDSELDNLVETDNVEALGTKADTLANKFKATAGRALIGDGVGGVKVLNNRTDPGDRQPSSEQVNGDDKKQSPSEDDAEEIVLESTRESIGAYSMFHYNGYEPSRTHMYTSSQKPGEPTADDSYRKEAEETVEDKGSNETTPVPSTPKEPTPPSSGRSISSQDPGKKAGVSFRSGTQFNAPDSAPSTTYNMGEWSAVGGTGGVLVDMSDTSSYSSANSSAFSTTSMEPTMRASALDTPFAKQVDQFVAKKDWDGLQLAAKSYDPTAAQANSRTSGASIEEKKRRKRELEERFSRSRSTSEERSDAHWA